MSLLQMERDRKHEKDRKPNQTGIPSYMKQDFEARSGLSYDDVRIHYSSPKPAELGALAYTQGSHVYIGPGQEEHLPHELVHVAQQKRGEVRPTGSLGNVSVNDDPELERQADEGIVVQRAQAPSGPSSQIVQRKIGMEYQTVGTEENIFVHKENEHDDDANAYKGPKILFFKTRKNIEVTTDGSDLEYVTPAVNTPKEAFDAGCAAADIHSRLMKGLIPDPSLKNWYSVTNNGSPYCKCYANSLVFLFKNLTDSAHPQATVGIRMENIADLLTDLGERKKGADNKNKDRSGIITLGLTSSKLMQKTKKQKAEDPLEKQKESMKNAPQKARTAVNNYLKEYLEDKSNDTESAEYKFIAGLTEKSIEYKRVVGLLSLLYAYNEQFLIIKKRPIAALNAKNAMPVMSRTSLYDAYWKLSEVERKIFRNSIKIDASAGWGEVPPGQSLAGQIILAGEASKKGDGTQQKKRYEWDAISLKTWFDGLEAGEDEMYNRFNSVGSLANTKVTPEYMKDTFGIQRSTDIGLGATVDGLLVELRGLERGVSCDRWGKIAGRVAYLADCLNNGKSPEEGQLPDFCK